MIFLKISNFGYFVFDKNGIYLGKYSQFSEVDRRAIEPSSPELAYVKRARQRPKRQQTSADGLAVGSYWVIKSSSSFRFPQKCQN